MGLKSMKINELREYAKERGIDIKGLRSKGDIKAAIEAAEAATDEQESEPIVVEAEVIEDEPVKTGELAVSFRPGVLSANFSALEAYIDGILETYKDWEPSADSQEEVKQCATHRKYLNGLAKQIDERRKAVKNEYLRPLNSFEADCNRIRDKVKDVSARLNDVEKEADEARKSQKEDELREHYEGYAGLLAEVVPYDKIADPKWLNKTPTLEKAKIELEEKVDKVVADWETLKRLNLEFFEQAEIQFFNTLDLGQATAYADKLAEDARKIEAMKAEIEQYAEPISEQDASCDDVPVAYESSPVACEADEYAPPHPIEEPADYEPFDPMTMEQEHRPMRPIPAQSTPMQPISAPASTPVSDSGSVSQQIAAILATYPESRQSKVLEALRSLQRPDNKPSVPYVMIIDGATAEQCRAVGKLCGLVGVTGTFKQGDLQEVAQRVAQEAVSQRQVFQYGA